MFYLFMSKVDVGDVMFDNLGCVDWHVRLVSGRPFAQRAAVMLLLD